MISSTSRRGVEAARSRRAARPWLAGLVLVLCELVSLGCASVRTGDYGVESLVIEGAEQLAPAAIKRCLLTMERDAVHLTLGVSQSGCRAPPFDQSPPSAALWTWPWTDWPSLNVAVVDVDRERIERFYRARGFYDARVVDVSYSPPEAADPADVSPGACDPRSEECHVAVTITVEEGEPLMVGRVQVAGLEALPEAMRQRLLDEALPTPGARFDELDYDRGKRLLTERLWEESFAAATVGGTVQLDHQAKLAHVSYRVEPGPAYAVGEVRVTGQGRLPVEPIVAAAGLTSGEPFAHSSLEDVQHEVYALGAFTSVEVDRELDAKTRRANLIIKVKPLQPYAFRLGVGVSSGALRRTQNDRVESVPQWDLHLLARYEQRHVFGSLSKLRIEDRPRLIFQRPFPRAGDERVGNVLSLRSTHPGVIEARTKLVGEALWDYGPDPFLGFTRSDVVISLGAERAFLRRSLFARLGLQHDRYLVPAGETTSDGSEVPESYVYSFVEQELRLDLRDDEVVPTRGIWASLRATQSLRMPLSDWTIYQLEPELRAFVPLPLGMVLGARGSLAALLVREANPELDPESQRLGPNAYRLRGGGAQSNRGFVAGELGVGREGGIRLWEASLELRVRLGGALVFALFTDFGDVNDAPRFRFAQPNPAAGFGLRYLTPVGNLRADFGFRLGKVSNPDPDSTLFGAQGAYHVTIGDAF